MLIGGPFEILFGLKAFKKAKATKKVTTKAVKTEVKKEVAAVKRPFSYTYGIGR